MKKKPVPPKMRLVREGKRKNLDDNLTGFQLAKKAGGWKKFWGRMLRAFGESFFVIFLCWGFATNWPDYFPWAFIVIPFLIVAAWYFNETDYYRIHND